MFLGPIRGLPRATAGFPAPRAQLALRPRPVPLPLDSRVEAAPLDEFALRTFRAVLGSVRRDHPHIAAQPREDRDVPPLTALPRGFTAEIGAVADDNGRAPFPDPLTVTQTRQKHSPVKDIGSGDPGDQRNELNDVLVLVEPKPKGGLLVAHVPSGPSHLDDACSQHGTVGPAGARVFFRSPRPKLSDPLSR